MWLDKTVEMPSPDRALPGREQELEITAVHHVNGHRMKPPYPEGCDSIQLALGCFWGAEQIFWNLPGVYSTAAGYVAGYTPNPTYQEVCSGQTGHTEAVLVIYQLAEISIEQLLRVFWESHDPTQGMRQGNDRGTQYRSGIYYNSPQQQAAARASRDRYQQALSKQSYPQITTEILQAGPFYYAEEYHQQYLAKNPDGYCGLGGTGVACSAD